MIIYIHNLNHRKSGGSHSQKILTELIINQKGKVIKIKRCGWFNFFYGAFKNGLFEISKGNIYILHSLDTTSKFKLFGINFNTAFFKHVINRFMLNILLKRGLQSLRSQKSKIICELVDSSTINSLSKFFYNSKIALLLRSSPHCLIWSNSYLLKHNIIECVNQADILISASQDVYDMWVEISKNIDIPFFRLNVPIPTKNLLNLSHVDEALNTFICICGSVGPRKGILLMIDAIGSYSKDLQQRSKLVVFGDVQIAMRKLLTKKLDLYKPYLELELKGYQNEPYDLSINRYKSAFVFGSFCENQSRAQLEAAKYKLPMFVNIKGISSELLANSSLNLRLFASTKNLIYQLKVFFKEKDSKNNHSLHESTDFTCNGTIDQVKRQLIEFESLE